MRKYLVLIPFFMLLVLVISCSTEKEVPKIAPKTGDLLDTQSVTENNTGDKPKQEISAEVMELLSKHKSKINSVYYRYRGPETGNNFYEFYIKSNKTKYEPHRETKSLDLPASYDSIFIDKATKTAQSYCIAAYCVYQGKKADLNYNDAYISTVFDWIDVDMAKKVGEEVIDDRNTWKIETNKGILWVDLFYGIPLKAESSGKVYKFEQIAVNSVTDADVTPS